MRREGRQASMVFGKKEVDVNNYEEETDSVETESGTLSGEDQTTGRNPEDSSIVEPVKPAA